MEFDDALYHAMVAEHRSERERDVGCKDSRLQSSGETHPHNGRDRQQDGLAQRRRSGLDSADTPPPDDG